MRALDNSESRYVEPEARDRSVSDIGFGVQKSRITSSTGYTQAMKKGKQVRTTTRAERRNDAEKDIDDDVDVDKEE